MMSFFVSDQQDQTSGCEILLDPQAPPDDNQVMMAMQTPMEVSGAEANSALEDLNNQIQ